MIREIVTIDEELCDGCGLCVPACHEGALQIINGKARLVADRLCDGLGACLGHCPKGAIRIERREAAEFDEAAVAAHVSAATRVAGESPARPGTPPMATPMGGCPGSRFAQFAAGASGAEGGNSAPARPIDHPSELTHWPVQLHLLSPHAPVLRNARLLVAADCVPIAYAGFHAELLRGRAVVIACPKLDETTGYVEKLTEMIARNELREVTVVHMEVPCCTGILHTVLRRGDVRSRRCRSRKSSSASGVNFWRDDWWLTERRAADAG